MSGQPDDWNDNEDCGQVVGYNFGEWNDENCDNTRKYICKHINCKWKEYSGGIGLITSLATQFNPVLFIQGLHTSHAVIIWYNGLWCKIYVMY